MIEFFERILVTLRQSGHRGRHHRQGSEGKTEARTRLRLVHLDFLYQMAHVDSHSTNWWWWVKDLGDQYKKSGAHFNESGFCIRFTLTNYIDEQAYGPCITNKRTYRKICIPPRYWRSCLNWYLTNINVSDTRQTYLYRFTDSFHRCPLPRESLWSRRHYRPLRLVSSSRCRGTLNLDRQHKHPPTHLRDWIQNSIWTGRWIWTTCVFSGRGLLHVSITRGTSEPCHFENPCATRLQGLNVLCPCRRRPTPDGMGQKVQLCDENKINADLDRFEMM